MMIWAAIDFCEINAEKTSIVPVLGVLYESSNTVGHWSKVDSIILKYNTTQKRTTMIKVLFHSSEHSYKDTFTQDIIKSVAFLFWLISLNSWKTHL